MTKDTMLGRIMQKLTELPIELLGMVLDFAGKMSGAVWAAEAKKFLRGEPCWVKVIQDKTINAFLHLISGGEALTIDAVDGTEILADASDVFANIGTDFKNWGADEVGAATDETLVKIYELTQNATLSQMFGLLSADVRKLCLTQAQIKNLVRKHHEWLRTSGKGTFFLFKSNGQFFVAKVGFYSVDSLSIGVFRLGHAQVWRAEYRHRLVVPQLT